LSAGIDVQALVIVLSISGRHQSDLSGDFGKFMPISRHTGNPCEHVVFQHQDHEGLVGHAVVFAPNPQTGCGNEAKGRVITGVAQDNKDMEVRKL
jgi:hypothetical protein